MNDMTQPQTPPQRGMPIQADAKLTVTLEAQEWNVVFAALNEMPMRVSRPVYDKLISQLNQAS
jgi:hypothetical protein